MTEFAGVGAGIRASHIDGMRTGTRKAFYRGTHRLVPPERTVERLRRLQDVFGITRIANITGLDCIGIPVVLVFRPNARSVAVSAGKGLDMDAARASGVMEAIELYHAERILHPLKLASWNELRFSHNVVPVEMLPFLSTGLFHGNRRVLWIEGSDLHGSADVWVPYELVHMNFTMPFPSGTGCFVMGSNGLASGNHTTEAVAHALCELIERDAMTLFHCRPVPERDALRVDLGTVNDAAALELLDRYDRAGVNVAVWDLTSDIGVPVFRCCILDRSTNPFRPVPVAEGLGCHPVREIALLRALTEAAQGRLVLITGSRDDKGRRSYSAKQDPLLEARAREASLRGGKHAFDAAPSIVNDTFEEDVASILDRLKRAGLEHAVLFDLTRPELDVSDTGFSVVRVVVPGLEPHFQFPGYVPGQRASRVLRAHAREVGA
jgi:ribosomal protein S12 methylthiotransferase accessory factor